MKPEELRIGNHVRSGKSTMIVHDIKMLAGEYRCMLMKNKFDSFSTDQEFTHKLQPVKLTEDVIEGFGFKWKDKKPYIGYYKPTKDGMNAFRVEYDGSSFFVVLNMYHRINLKYTHELQNIYYVLMNEELNFTESSNN